ncbi:hypothetical protein SELMODRAFT_414278 [Selaginella moellendorffii]|uniref:DNA replication checkpoint mediator MRC1 domain-containing protein n=1 Tax=Selaginella moellendorffii TaxID=88036 RepID=D8RS85_SELML|nr:hypothetical protein SELMODRAFT_414278 [Selaginella moellendorffii]
MEGKLKRLRKVRQETSIAGFDERHDCSSTGGVDLGLERAAVDIELGSEKNADLEGHRDSTGDARPGDGMDFGGPGNLDSNGSLEGGSESESSKNSLDAWKKIAKKSKTGEAVSEDNPARSGMGHEDLDPTGSDNDSETSRNSLDELLSDGIVTKKKRKVFARERQAEELLSDGIENEPARSGVGNGSFSGSESSKNSLDELLSDGVVTSSKKRKRIAEPENKPIDAHSLQPSSSLQDDTKHRVRKVTKKELDEMHAESQRLLRETREAAFEAAPVVEVPMSGLLSKLRQRKIQLGWKSKLKVSHQNDVDVGHDTSQLPTISTSYCENEDECSGMNKVLEDTSSSKESPVRCSNAFRQPLEDTQDLFPDSQALDYILAGSQDNYNGGIHLDLHMTESQDEALGTTETVEAFPVKPPIMALIDDEAEAEDEDLILHNSEEDEGDDSAEVLEIIDRSAEAEEPLDNGRRADLHRQWLEQQDEAQTDSILWRIQGSSKQTEYTAEISSFLDADDSDPQELSRGTSVKLKETKEAAPPPSIGLEFLEEDMQIYHESSDDEETERTILRQRLLETAERQELFMSPADDESSREVLGIIKKANVSHSTTKRKSAQQETCASVCKSKSIFSNRSTSNSSLLKQTICTNSKSFIFGRDDSSSLSGFPVAAQHTVNKETAAPKPIEQRGPSLFSILKQQQTDHPRPGERIVMADKLSIFGKFPKRKGKY